MSPSFPDHLPFSLSRSEASARGIVPGARDVHWPALAILLLSVFARTSGAAAQDGSAARMLDSPERDGGPPSRVSVDSPEWDVWIDGERCLAPCSVAPRRGGLDLGLAGTGEPTARHQVHVALEDAVSIHIETWSHAAERTAGHFTIGLGWLIGVPLGVALGVAAGLADYDSGPGGDSLGWDADDYVRVYAVIVGVPAGIGLGLLATIVGGILADWDDHPTAEVRTTIVPTLSASERGATVGLAGTF